MRSLTPALVTLSVAIVCFALLRGERAADEAPATSVAHHTAAAARRVELRPNTASAEVLRLRRTIERSLVDHAFRETVVAADALATHVGFDLAALLAKSDALLELGDIDAAEATVQQVLDLKPGPSAYARAAYLLHLGGEPQRAIEVMELAGSALQPADVERRAWIETELGELCRLSGRDGDAERHYELALRLRPRGTKARLGLARLAWSRGELDAAADAFGSNASSPAELGELASIYEQLGRRNLARRVLLRALHVGGSDPHWARSLALCIADHADDLDDGDAARAVTLAEAELRVRPGVHTWDALAWALVAAGREREALRASEHALRWGTREPALLFHAGVAAERLGDPRAEAWLREAFALDPALRARRAATQLTLAERKS